MIKREERTLDRFVHRLAKGIYHGLKAKSLDPQTLETFKWQRKRLSLYERMALSQSENGPQIVVSERQQKESDKGRVRKIKAKVWHVLLKSEVDQKRLLGPEWFEKF